MSKVNANYHTPVGAFFTWEDAARAVERCDMDPCEVIAYRPAASSGPELVCRERAYGSDARLSFSVKCF